MSDIEKEFFEAFGIDKVRECELRSACFLGFAHTCDKCDIYGQAFEVYPPTTSDIILRLSKILMDFGWLHCEKFTIDKYLTEFDNDELKDKIQFVEHNFEDCILKLCIKLKDEISEEVKALFQC